MPYFDPTPSANSVPEGRRQFLRSTEGLRTESATVSAANHPSETVGGEVRKILQSGEALAKITSGPEAGKSGVFQVDATDGRGDIANLIGINETYEPWRLLPQTGSPQDVEVGYVVDARVVQAWCTIRDASGARVPMTDAVAAALNGAKGCNILFA